MTVACTYKPMGGTVCTQYTNYPSAEKDTLDNSCTGTFNGTTSDGCDTSNLLGCCETPVPGGLTDYSCYYNDWQLTIDELKMTCTQPNQTWVDAP